MRESQETRQDVHLIIGEFETLTKAHQAAAEISKFSVRWVDISATAGGAWACAITTSSADDAEKYAPNFEAVSLNDSCFKALLSLAENTSPSRTDDFSATEIIGIVEGSRIIDVLKSALFYSSQGHQPLEIRVKRAGPASGAHAFFSKAESHPKTETEPKDVLKINWIELRGDHRRYFKN